MKTFEQLAAEGYKAYCKQAGGLTFDGKIIPGWEHLGAERQACWTACAKAVVAHHAVPVVRVVS